MSSMLQKYIKTSCCEKDLRPPENQCGKLLHKWIVELLCLTSSKSEHNDSIPQLCSDYVVDDDNQNHN